MLVFELVLFMPLAKMLYLSHSLQLSPFLSFGFCTSVFISWLKWIPAKL